MAIAPKPSLASLYVRARAAEAAGDASAANAGFTALLAEAPDNTVIASRTYRQAIAAGNMPLALKAARALDAKNVLPPDGRALLALEQIRSRDWAKAGAATERLAQDRVFGFLAPYFRAWIAVGSGTGDALSLAQGGQSQPLAAPYRAEQKALLLLAMGRAQEANAVALDPGSIKLPTTIRGADQGLAYLLVHVASDFARQQMAPVGLIMARLSTYSDPEFASGWLVVGDLLRRMERPDLGLAAVANVKSDDALAPSAHAMRIGLLADSGRRDVALAEAITATKRPEAIPDDWGRVGDLYMVLERPADAAQAYARAIGLAEAAKSPPQAIWPLLLQQGGALDLAGDWPGAKAALARAYMLAPDQAVVLNQYGYSLIEHHEDIARASGLIEQASKLRPDDSAITDSLGWVLYLRGQPDQAVPLLERAAAGAPGESAINEHLGDVYWALGRQIEARYAWRAALVTAEEKFRSRLNAKIDLGPSGTPAAP